MSMDSTSERVCYVHCNFCNTILAVSVPCSSMYAIVTVRCGHCSNLLSVNVGALLHHLHPPLQVQDLHHHHHLQKQQSSNSSSSNEDGSKKENNNIGTSSSSSRCTKFTALDCGGDHHDHDHDQPTRITPIRPPEKRQRVPSAYNRFIKEEIQRIKASNPEITHREAFSTAAKNWAHFPHIHFGLKLDGNKLQNKLDLPTAPDQQQTPPPPPPPLHKSRAFY